MKYLGRQDLHEGSEYPIGFHWGYISTLVSKLRLERYMILHIRLTSFLKIKLELSSDTQRLHAFALLLFAAWPHRDFEGAFRHRFICYWIPLW